MDLPKEEYVYRYGTNLKNKGWENVSGNLWQRADRRGLLYEKKDYGKRAVGFKQVGSQRQQQLNQENKKTRAALDAQMKGAYGRSSYSFDQMPGWGGWSVAPEGEDTGGDTGPTGPAGPAAPAFDAAAYLRELIGQIDLGYAKSVSQLEQGRAGQMQRLMEQQNEFKNLLARNRQTYEQGAAMAAQEIANRATAGQQRATELANQLANAMRLEGVSAQPLQAQAQLQQQLMQQSQGYQQDYQTRMNQLAAQRFADAERSSELIRQGAGGQLENQYRALQTALERQRLQDIMGAQKQIAEQEIDMQKAAAAAARASAGGGLKDVLLQLQIAEKTQALQDPFGASIRKNLPDWLALFQGSDEASRAALAPYLQQILGQ